MKAWEFQSELQQLCNWKLYWIRTTDHSFPVAPFLKFDLEDEKFSLVSSQKVRKVEIRPHIKINCFIGHCNSNDVNIFWIIGKIKLDIMKQAKGGNQANRVKPDTLKGELGSPALTDRSCLGQAMVGDLSTRLFVSGRSMGLGHLFFLKIK